MPKLTVPLFISLFAAWETSVECAVSPVSPSWKLTKKNYRLLYHTKIPIVSYWFSDTIVDFIEKRGKRNCGCEENQFVTKYAENPFFCDFLKFWYPVKNK